MQKEIIVSQRNRDGAKLWLEQIGDSSQYILKTNKPFVLEYCRVIFDEVPQDALIYDFDWGTKKGLCRAYDPAGGPYISVGSNITKDYKINRIFVDYNDNRQLKFSVEKI